MTINQCAECLIFWGYYKKHCIQQNRTYLLLHPRLCKWNICKITSMQRCETRQPLHFNKFAIVISEPISCKQHAVFSLWLSAALASGMNKINVRERYHCWILSPWFSSKPFSQHMNQMNDNSRTYLHLSQPAVPRQSLFFPSPPNWEAACCLNFPSNPSLPFPISTLDLQRPALLTKWENRLKWKASCFTESRHMT